MKSTLNKLLALVLSLCVVLSLSACGSSDSNNASGTGNTATSADGNATAETENTEELPSEIRIGYWASPNSELLVKETGALEALYPDITVNWIEFTSGADILTAIQAGSIDFSTIGSPPGTTGIVNEYPFSVYYVEDIIGESEGLIVKEDSGIDSLEDLAGKTIATSFSTTSHYSFLQALNNAGVDASAITIMDMDASNIYAAWERGDIDGAYIWESVKTQLTVNGGKQIISSAEVAEDGTPTCEFGIVHNDFAAKYPNVVKSYIDLLDAATDEFNNNTEEAAAQLSNGLGLTQEETLKAMSGIIELTKEDQATYLGNSETPGSLISILKSTSDFLYEQGKLTSSPDEETFQNAILTSLYD